MEPVPASVPQDASRGTLEERFKFVFDHVVSTAERVGIPITTFAIGAWAIFFSTASSAPALPWVGMVLIVASLATYVWLTDRSTPRVPSLPPPLQPELVALLEWMKGEISMQQHWARQRISSD